MKNYQAFVLEQNETNKITGTIQTLPVPRLEPEEVLIQVAYSSVNYKDALAAQANSGVLKKNPITPGIDASGTIIASATDKFSVGDQVIATSYGIGVSQDGGYGQLLKVPAAWVVLLPKQLTLKTAMTIGTAGLTAAIAIHTLEKNGLSENKQAKILITGATGGVGNFAIGILHRLGYKNIYALTRKKTTATDYLLSLGATEVFSPDEFVPKTIKPLMKQTFDQLIDTVGGDQLAALLPQLSYGGSACLCGNAGGINIQTTVLPFILRNISLFGIDSVNYDHDDRILLWEKLAHEYRPIALEKIATKEIELSDLPSAFSFLINGTFIGRTIVKIADPSDYTTII